MLLCTSKEPSDTASGGIENNGLDHDRQHPQPDSGKTGEHTPAATAAGEGTTTDGALDTRDGQAGEGVGSSEGVGAGAGGSGSGSGGGGGSSASASGTALLDGSYDKELSSIRGQVRT